MAGLLLKPFNMMVHSADDFWAGAVRGQNGNAYSTELRDLSCGLSAGGMLRIM
jgi:hypothetical protein